MNRRIVAALMLTLTGSLQVIGQTKMVEYDLYEQANNKKLKVFNREVNSFSEGDRKGIRFSSREGDGVALLEGLTFSEGTIELDIRGKDVLQQSFVGVGFHAIDGETLDVIYFRPFNFQSADPVRKIHAVQYVSHPAYPWDRLRKEHNGQYEKAITPPPKADEWFHVKIILKYPMVMVYVNNNTEPSLTVTQLSNRKTGQLGLWVGNNSDGDFSNLKVTSN
jgi:hypothetical protein